MWVCIALAVFPIRIDLCSLSIDSCFLGGRASGYLRNYLNFSFQFKKKYNESKNTYITLKIYLNFFQGELIRYKSILHFLNFAHKSLKGLKKKSKLNFFKYFLWSRVYAYTTVRSVLNVEFHMYRTECKCVVFFSLTLDSAHVKFHVENEPSFLNKTRLLWWGYVA